MKNKILLSLLKFLLFFQGTGVPSAGYKEKNNDYLFLNPVIFPS